MSCFFSSQIIFVLDFQFLFCSSFYFVMNVVFFLMNVFFFINVFFWICCCSSSYLLHIFFHSFVNVIKYIFHIRFAYIFFWSKWFKCFLLVQNQVCDRFWKHFYCISLFCDGMSPWTRLSFFVWDYLKTSSILGYWLTGYNII